MTVEWDCDCCGHTVLACGCPNAPDPWDKCHNQSAYICRRCGRTYYIHHHSSVDAIGQPCTGAECDGNLVRRVAGHHPLAGAFNLYGTEHPRSQ